MTSGVRFINYNTNQIIAEEDAIAAAINGMSSSNVGNLGKYAVVMTIDGGGGTPTTGVKGNIFVPWVSTITRVTLLADISGSAVIDIWMIAYGSYPPTVSNSITASDLPTLSSAIKYQDSTLTGWTTAVPALSTLRFNLNSASTLTQVVLILEMTKN